MTEIIIALIGALTGGGLTGVFAWRASRKKAEADAMKSVQEVYQQTLEDQQKYISQLRDTRDHLVTDREEMRRENNELRKRLNEMDDKVRQLEHDVARNGRVVANLRPFLCGRVCKNRINVDLGSSDGEVPDEMQPDEKETKNIKKRK